MPPCFSEKNYLACGSSSGSLSVFNLDDVLREQRGSGGDTSSPDPSPRPSLVVPDAHRGAVYSVIAFTLQGSEMLCSAKGRTGGACCGEPQTSSRPRTRKRLGRRGQWR